MSSQAIKFATCIMPLALFLGSAIFDTAQALPVPNQPARTTSPVSAKTTPAPSTKRYSYTMKPQPLHIRPLTIEEVAKYDSDDDLFQSDSPPDEPGNQETEPDSQEAETEPEVEPMPQPEDANSEPENPDSDTEAASSSTSTTTSQARDEAVQDQSPVTTAYRGPIERKYKDYRRLSDIQPISYNDIDPRVSPSTAATTSHIERLIESVENSIKYLKHNYNNCLSLFILFYMALSICIYIYLYLCYKYRCEATILPQ